MTDYRGVRREGMGKYKINLLSVSDLMVSGTLRVINRDWGLQTGRCLEGKMS